MSENTNLHNEEWRPIAGYEGIYDISSHGRVKSLRRQRKTGSFTKEYIKPSYKNWLKYERVQLSNSGVNKIYSVHRLVAIAFIPNPENKPTVNHINNTPYDNRVENLEWATMREQHIHALTKGNRPKGDNHPRRKATSHLVACIKEFYRTSTVKRSEVHKYAGVSNAIVYRILKYKDRDHSAYKDERAPSTI